MALERAYPVDINTLYPVETDIYLKHLEAVDTFKTADELAAKVVDATIQMADHAVEVVRKIETERRRLSYYAAVLFKLQRDHPEAVTRLPQEIQDIVHELGSRSVLAPSEASAIIPYKGWD